MQAIAGGRWKETPHRAPSRAPSKHETEWCLSAYSGGLLVRENAEAEENKARHMKCVPRERVLGLWLALVQGDLAAVEAEPWLPGYG